MVSQIVAPKLGMSMSDVTIVEWRFKEGEKVEKGTAVLVIETEKTEWNVEAGASGFLHILVEEGRKAKIGQVVGLIWETKEEFEKLQKGPPPQALTAEVKTVPPAEGAGGKPEATRVATGEGERLRISPIARKMAEEQMVDITRVKGTGPDGRIVKEDIEKALEEQKKVAVPPEEVTRVLYQGKKLKETIPLKGMRRAIAERMQASLAGSAQLSFLGKFDATELIQFRKALLNRGKTDGVNISYTEILVYMIARALKDHPDINVSLIENEIKAWEDINIGVAVALGKQGLLVPVVKQADKKSLTEISQEVKSLVEKARGGGILPDEVTGGTFTLTSIGAVGVSDYQTPVLNQPESAILGIGPIRDEAVVKDGQIVIASMMPYSLTVDHRVINGFGAEQFLASLKELVETPSLLK
ncbi:MAG TPA: dihydrolipoamide acetyltransferase family protein [Thermodesulfobacteriota bacterium]|nr:dihydrolipoamide acetyltransferase family protein [Thermodesulfobacteriota bacterium]